MLESDAAATVRRLVTAFGKNDFRAVRDCLTDDIVYRVPGRSSISGMHEGKDAAMRVAQTLGDVAAGTLILDVHDIVSSDQHAALIFRLGGERNNRRLDCHMINLYDFSGPLVCRMSLWIDDQDAFDAFYSG